jgi:predicted metallopeptidase
MQSGPGGLELSEPRPQREPSPQNALVLSWPAPPVRRIRASRAQCLGPLQAAPPWFDSGPVDQPFDFCGHIRRLLDDVVVRCPDLAHIRVPQVLIAVTQARSTRAHGLQARVTPLRFQGGALTRLRRGVPFQVQRYFIGAHEYLYLLTFCLPRFLNQDYDDKLVTVLHELYHISPSFDGDLRRHDGRYQMHTHSQRAYDRHMADLARGYLAASPDPARLAFLRLNFAQLEFRHGAVHGVVVPRPRIIPILGQAAQIRGERDSI